MKRKVAIFTGNRAEYGLQFPIIKAISNHPNLDYYLLVSGAHLQEDFGSTSNEIKEDGFSVYKEVKLDMISDTLLGTVHAIATGMLSLSRILDELKPDLMVVYADRFEGFSAVITSSQLGIPTAHIEGGDITEGGALDDSVRHAMTKLSHLHFTTNSEAAERIIKLGEEPWRVHNVGFPAIDLIKQGNFATPEEVKNKYKIDLSKPIVLFTQHSVTTEFEQAQQQIEPSIEAMAELAQDGCQIFITYPNNDAGGLAIIRKIESLNLEKIPNLIVINSLGRYYYHGILNICGNEGIGVCVGNSSSGIKETPAFHCPNVNVGSRQNGRLRAENVIDADYNKTKILQATKKALFDNEFRASCKRIVNPYGEGNSGSRIAEILASVEINKKLVQKKMTY